MYKKYSVFLILATNFAYTFAQGCGLNGDDAPALSDIACILGRIIAIAIGLAGAVAVAMIGYGAIKLAMSLGDPKGYAGALATWQYAVMGIFAVIGAFAIFAILANILGVSLSPSGLTNQIQAALGQLLAL